MKDEEKVSDEDLMKYVNASFTEQVIQKYENQILAVMKHRQDIYPSELNDNEWLAYTNMICRRRCQHVFKVESVKSGTQFCGK